MTNIKCIGGNMRYFTILIVLLNISFSLLGKKTEVECIIEVDDKAKVLSSTNEITSVNYAKIKQTYKCESIETLDFSYHINSNYKTSLVRCLCGGRTELSKITLKCQERCKAVYACIFYSEGCKKK